METEKTSQQLIENLLFTKIFQTFRMSIHPSKLIIAFMAVALICFAGWIMDLSTKTVVTAANAETELQIYINDTGSVEDFIESNKETGGRTGVYSTLWGFTASRFQGAVNSLFELNIAAVAGNIADYFKAIVWAVRYHTAYCVILFFIKLAVICLAAGALCRMAALEFACGEKPGLVLAMRYSVSKFPSFFCAPLAPVVIIFFTGVGIFVLGLLGNIPRAGELIIGISMPLALTAGTLVAVVSIGAIAGFNLVFPAVAYDGSDCFDAISRSFSYVFSKPWRMAFYSSVAAVYGSICYTFVRFFAFLLLLITQWALQLGVWVDSSSGQSDKLSTIWPEPTFMNLLGSPSAATLNWSESFSQLLIRLFILLAVGLVVAFVISFYFSANTIIYAALRKQVDKTSMDDIYSMTPQTEKRPSEASGDSETE